MITGPEGLTFKDYQKVGITRISDQVYPKGTRVLTYEGEYVCAEPSRIALDVSGNIYPIAESIFVESYRNA